MNIDAYVQELTCHAAGDQLRMGAPHRDGAATPTKAAVNVSRGHNVESIDLLSREQGVEPLEGILKGRAVELWSELAQGAAFHRRRTEAGGQKLGEPRGST